MKKKRIFVSGALNSDSIGFLKNVRKMLIVGHQVRKNGFRAYVPCDDILISLVGGCFEHESHLNYDLDELEECHALLLVPGYENSKGVKGEREKAKELDIPEFQCMCELKKYFGVN
jgi:hypothetical protein